VIHRVPRVVQALLRRRLPMFDQTTSDTPAGDWLGVAVAWLQPIDREAGRPSNGHILPRARQRSRKLVVFWHRVSDIIPVARQFNLYGPGLPCICADKRLAGVAAGW
jgi:hypothetical protein